jgi:hypothetical protein
MTRLNTMPVPPPKPATIVLCELALAAGVAGHCVALCYRDLPAPVACQLYKHCIRFAGAATVRHVRALADVRKLADEVGQVRLVIVYSLRLRNPTGVARSNCLCLSGCGRVVTSSIW